MEAQQKKTLEQIDKEQFMLIKAQEKQQNLAVSTEFSLTEIPDLPQNLSEHSEVEQIKKELYELLNQRENSYSGNKPFNIANQDYLLCLIQYHRNGYIREKTLLLISHMNISYALPVIISRLNDWVPNVRNAAKLTINKLLNKDNTLLFLAYFKYFHNLLLCQRDNHLIIYQEVVNFLIKKENLNLLIDFIINNNNTSKLVFSLCLDKKLLADSHVIKLAVQHKSAHIRLLAINYLIKNQYTFTQDELFSFLNDNSAKIKVTAFKHLTNLYKNLTPTELKPLLFDNNAYIRKKTLNLLNEQGINLVMFYLNIIRKKENTPNKKIVYTLWGLFILKCDDIEKICLSFKQHPNVAIRKMVIYILATLKGKQAKNLLIQAIKNEHSSINKMASYLLIKNNIDLSLTDLQLLANNIQSLSQYYSYLTLSKQLNKWDKLIFLLNLLIDYPNNKTKEHLMYWYNNHQYHLDILPSQQQIQQLLTTNWKPIISDPIIMELKKIIIAYNEKII